MKTNGLLFTLLLVGPESGVLKGLTDVVQSAGLPSSAHAIGEMLGYALLVLFLRLMAWATSIVRQRFPSVVAVNQTVIAPAAGAGPDVAPISPPVAQPGPTS